MKGNEALLGLNKSSKKHKAPALPSYKLNGLSGVLAPERNSDDCVNSANTVAR